MLDFDFELDTQTFHLDIILNPISYLYLLRTKRQYAWKEQVALIVPNSARHSRNVLLNICTT
ncbi:hypothetical protein L207DRAFT_17278 [Hyaloscypha variabilis F]|uniref:Uncharacterized protein n=1 Tax=Hyaloscypha variabilis (strain UAMH 11265 / GT02V1 / F) TaxID=1149755 RepID=A0A2J6SDF0_HYAVF|nr:hypothetical protein L207DRAFT_17278 [Hyaloscypha variabilis F]